MTKYNNDLSKFLKSFNIFRKKLNYKNRTRNHRRWIGRIY